MSAPEFELQPGQDLSGEESVMDSTEKPIQKWKSNVIRDPNALTQTPKYEKHDTVLMAIQQNGVRTRGTFTVHQSQLNRGRGFIEYQLKQVDGDGTLYMGGEWFRERDLKSGRRG
ncbi:hypothetical protein GQ43DRAFT_216431 [Delitschia confertaspora ATCC 74209]|uniref:Uncharacterized protein n=1 Tax=Delitschia confertaspora ATCC 74209 TaxID=1513339 RepID=A0A9P4MNL5_9PLEO|nr:hypothetical protein GQ43DRAFT_216431 [Delitschia confertaspora ATCC 74209]